MKSRLFSVTELNTSTNPRLNAKYTPEDVMSFKNGEGSSVSYAAHFLKIIPKRLVEETLFV